jgi:adenine-specific DNA-methyltransferase
MAAIDRYERDRQTLQIELDAQKTKTERNRLGQFATPMPLARDILAYAKMLLPEGESVRFIDPAVGTSAFYSALRETFPARQIREAVGIEIDPHYGNPARELWEGTKLDYRLGDFTAHDADQRFNLLVCNPPYVRHHHMPSDYKARLQLRTQKACGVKIAGLAGLYCYFLGLSHAWLAPRAISAWLIPSEFMDVNYGQAVKRYLLERVTLLHIHRFDPSDVQFADALVSSAVVWFRNEPPPPRHEVKFTFGGLLSAPKIARNVAARALSEETKWTRFPVAATRRKSNLPTVADFFKIKRGIATGDNSYFILSEAEVAARNLPRECFRPILPSPRYVNDDEIEADHEGIPLIDRRLFLLDLRLPEDEIERRHPIVWAYLQEGRARGLHERYLCKHRALWYAQEIRPAPPIICTYLGRSDSKSGRPFRFFLNRSKATVANVYLAMYPTPVLEHAFRRDPQMIRAVWQVLNSITPAQLLGEGRVYGGGLHKLEPKELANVPAQEIAQLLPEAARPKRSNDLFCTEAAE